MRAVKFKFVVSRNDSLSVLFSKRQRQVMGLKEEIMNYILTLKFMDSQHLCTLLALTNGFKGYVIAQ